MMGSTSIAILIPVLDRPQRVRPLLNSIWDSGRYTNLRPIFLCSPGDADEIEAVADGQAAHMDWAIERHIMEWTPDHGDYARKINWGFTNTYDEWVLTASDDLHFRPGWAERALACHLETHACVIGTNDLANERVTRGEHSTHTLVHRDYGECGTIDESGKLLHEGYDHNYCDSEFVETAKARETWAHATDSIIEHFHPLWQTADDDATYRKGQIHVNDDRNRFNRRRPLWYGA